VEIVLGNQTAQKQKLLSAWDTFARQQNLPAVVRHAAEVALEEHLTNIMSYAYEDTLPHEIRVRLELEEGCLAIEVEDDGRAFDPLQRPQVDTSLPLEKKPVGGLGIHLIRRFMDDVQYCRKANKNILRLRKRLPG
jgi:anti-sigma regulatory factor (Ser/Thr protein kinase)